MIIINRNSYLVILDHIIVHKSLAWDWYDITLYEQVIIDKIVI